MLTSTLKWLYNTCILMSYNKPASMELRTSSSTHWDTLVRATPVLKRDCRSGVRDCSLLRLSSIPGVCWLALFLLLKLSDLALLHCCTVLSERKEKYADWQLKHTIKNTSGYDINYHSIWGWQDLTNEKSSFWSLKTMETFLFLKNSTLNWVLIFLDIFILYTISYQL